MPGSRVRVPLFPPIFPAIASGPELRFQLVQYLAAARRLAAVRGVRADARVHHRQRRLRPREPVIATEDKAFDQATVVHMATRMSANITKVSASQAGDDAQLGGQMT